MVKIGYVRRLIAIETKVVKIVKTKSKPYHTLSYPDS